MVNGFKSNDEDFEDVAVLYRQPVEFEEEGIGWCESGCVVN